MKASRLLRALLAVMLCAGLASRSRANLFTDDFNVIAIAERGKGATEELAKPTSFVAFDGGYIEAGDPIAGDDPPAAGQVRQALVGALEAQGFHESQTVPSLLVIYHYGVLRVDHRQIKVPFQVRSNLSARIALVSTTKMDAEIENHIRDHERATGENINYASPRFLVAPLDSVVAQARLPRIFVEVSAYDFQAFFQKHEARLVWRTKLSAQESSGRMDQVIPPMLASGARFLGADSAEFNVVPCTLSPKPAPGAPAAAPAPESYHLDSRLVNDLTSSLRVQISGEQDAP